MKPREFWLGKHGKPIWFDSKPYNDEMFADEFIHVREVMPDVPQCRMTEKEFTEIHEQIIFLNKKLDRMTRALERVMAEVKVNTDKAFYEHCKSKVEKITSGEDKHD